MAVSGPVLEQALAVLTVDFAGPVLEGQLDVLPSAFSGPVFEDTLAVIPGGVSGPVFEAEMEVTIPVFSGPTGGVMPPVEPAQTYHGPTDGIAEIAPDQTYSGTTDGEANIPPTQTYSGATTGFLPITNETTFGGPTPGVSPVPPPRSYGAPTPGFSSSLPPSFGFGAATGGVFLGFPGPLSLTATVIDAGCIRLDWVDPMIIAEDGFRIERSLENMNDWTEIASLPADSNTFLDRFAVPLVVYDYRVIGFLTGGEESQPSNIATAVTPLPPDIATGPPPTAPADPQRNRLRPDQITFESPGIYGLEKDDEGNVQGFKY